MFGYININQKELTEEGKKSISGILLWALQTTEIKLWNQGTDDACI